LIWCKGSHVFDNQIRIY